MRAKKAKSIRKMFKMNGIDLKAAVVYKEKVRTKVEYRLDVNSKIVPVTVNKITLIHPIKSVYRRFKKES